MSLPVPEFSHIVNVRDLHQDGANYDISASETDCAKLAARFGLVTIGGLNAKLRLARRAQGAVRLNGKITAQVTQTCVATLDTVREDIEVDIDIVFRPNFDDLALDDPEIDNELDFEPLIGDTLDIGEIVSEEMALSLTPYPRAAAAPMIGPDSDDVDAGSRSERPFAALAALNAGNAEN